MHLQPEIARIPPSPLAIKSVDSTLSEGFRTSMRLSHASSQISSFVDLGRNQMSELVHQSSELMHIALRPTSGPPKTQIGEMFPRAHDFVRSPTFEALVAMVILVNCCTIGVEVNAMVEYPAEWLSQFLVVAEHLFTAFFLAEFFLRMAFFGWRIYMPAKGGPIPVGDACWNLLDAFLVWFTGVLFVWILAPLNVDLSSFRVLTAFRAFRLFRFVRVVRKIPVFKEVVMLISGLADSARTLIWTIVVLLFITYIFAVFGVVLISTTIADISESATATDDVEALAQLRMEFGGVDNLMYTLVQVLTLDSWNGIARPLVHYMTWTWLFFYSYIAIAVVVLMNLVTAVIVENALASSAKDAERQLALKEAQDAKAFERFKDIFQVIDVDGDGTVSIEEFSAAMDKPQVTNQLQLLDFKPEDCKLIFELLDGGDGELSLDEFFGGLSQMKGAASAKGSFILEKRLDQMGAALQQLGSEVAEDNRVLSGALGVRLPPRESCILTRAKKSTAPKNSTPVNGVANKSIFQRAVTMAPGLPIRSPATPTSKLLGSLSKASASPSTPLGPDLGERLDRLMWGMDILTQEVSAHMDNMASRLDSVEQETTAAAQSLTELVAQPVVPSEWRRKHPALRTSPGKPLSTPCEGFSFFASP